VEPTSHQLFVTDSNEKGKVALNRSRPVRAPSLVGGQSLPCFIVSSCIPDKGG